MFMCSGRQQLGPDLKHNMNFYQVLREEWCEKLVQIRDEQF